jgi:hypothetical protein
LSFITRPLPTSLDCPFRNFPTSTQEYTQTAIAGSYSHDLRHGVDHHDHRRHNAAMLEPLRIIPILLEIMFLAAIARYAWQHRENKFVFWGWIVVIAILAIIDYWAFRAGLL